MFLLNPAVEDSTVQRSKQPVMKPKFRSYIIASCNIVKRLCMAVIYHYEIFNLDTVKSARLQ